LKKTVCEMDLAKLQASHHDLVTVYRATRAPIWE
jgi:hypothetical protein